MTQILYIGDDQQLTESLSRPEVKIFSFKSPVHAEKWIDRGGKPDAVLCENEIQGSNAINFFRFFKKKYGPQHPAPFLILGSRLSPEEVKKALKLGVADVFTKPVKAERLIKRINILNEIGELFRTSAEPDKETEYKPYRIPLFKRLFDIIMALAGLLVSAPLLLIIALAIRVESKGNIFYASKRVGAGYKIFNFYKFRSMYSNADSKIKELSYLNQYEQSSQTSPNEEPGEDDMVIDNDKIPFLIGDETVITETTYLESKRKEKNITFKKFGGDPRMTKVGKIIRRLSLDEIPQFINVLKGDMSVVGNRPLPLYEAELLTTDDWSERFLGPAGITGLWQVEARGRSKKMSPEERKQLDNKYAQIAQSRYCFFIDIWIILRTIPAVFQKENV